MNLGLSCAELSGVVRQDLVAEPVLHDLEDDDDDDPTRQKHTSVDDEAQLAPELRFGLVEYLRCIFQSCQEVEFGLHHQPQSDAGGLVQSSECVIVTLVVRISHLSPHEGTKDCYQEANLLMMGMDSVAEAMTKIE